MVETGNYCRFVCPREDCEEIEYPLVHTYRSTCGGSMEWRGRRIFCTRCENEATRYYWCDQCGVIDSARERCVY